MAKAMTATAMTDDQPPTLAEVLQAKERLASQRSKAQIVDSKIKLKKEELELVLAGARRTLEDLEEQRVNLEEEISSTQAFVAPVRRLPDDVLREVFWEEFDLTPSCCWVLSAVCSRWRRLVLGMPRLWSKISIVTTPSCPPEIIRLWLERSGTRCPLDIEIYLHIPPSHSRPQPFSVPPKRHMAPPLPPPPQVVQAPWQPIWSPPPHHGPLPATNLVLQQNNWDHTQNTFITQTLDSNAFHLGVTDSIPVLPMSTSSSPDPYPGNQMNNMPSSSGSGRRKTRGKFSSLWGHIAVYYLSEQMHRWRKFIFRFDKRFESMRELRNLSGDTPLLEEFEVSSGEALRSDPDLQSWQWLPNAATSVSESGLPKLKSVTLQYVPFKWSSPLLSTGHLRTLSLRAPPNSNPTQSHNGQALTVDRLRSVLAANAATLQHLTLHFTSLAPAILPLVQTQLPVLKELFLGGALTMSNLMDSLVTPSLDALAIAIDRDLAHDGIGELLARSGSPPITRLALASAGSTLYYTPDNGNGPWALLGSLPQLRSLQVSGSSIDNLILALSRNDDDDGVVDAGGPVGDWLCPHLERLVLRGCTPSPHDPANRLVQLLEARNPLPFDDHTAGIGSPSRLKTLEVYDCIGIGEDLVEWARSRVEDVKYSEAIFSRLSTCRSPSPNWNGDWDGY